MAISTDDIASERRELRVGRSHEERLSEATELVADTLESLKSEIADLSKAIEALANK